MDTIHQRGCKRLQATVSVKGDLFLFAAWAMTADTVGLDNCLNVAIVSLSHGIAWRYAVLLHFIVVVTRGLGNNGQGSNNGYCKKDLFHVRKAGISF